MCSKCYCQIRGAFDPVTLEEELLKMAENLGLSGQYRGSGGLSSRACFRSSFSPIVSNRCLRLNWGRRHPAAQDVGLTRQKGLCTAHDPAGAPRAAARSSMDGTRRPAIVMDCGTGYTKLGYAGNVEVRDGSKRVLIYQFPTVADR